MTERVLLDTNAVIDGAGAGYAIGVSVMTLAELRVGVLRAATAAERALRADRFALAEQTFDVHPVGREVAAEYARLAAILREQDRVVRPVDTIIAATAVMLGIPVITSDAHYEPLAQLGGVSVIWVAQG